MILEKDDLKQMKGIVLDSENRIIKTVEKIVDKKVNDAINDAKRDIITILSREVNDLADINRAVIQKTEKHDLRIHVLEERAGIA